MSLDKLTRKDIEGMGIKDYPANALPSEVAGALDALPPVAKEAALKALRDDLARRLTQDAEKIQKQLETAEAEAKKKLEKLKTTEQTLKESGLEVPEKVTQAIAEKSAEVAELSRKREALQELKNTKPARESEPTREAAPEPVPPVEPVRKAAPAAPTKSVSDDAEYVAKRLQEERELQNSKHLTVYPTSAIVGWSGGSPVYNGGQSHKVFYDTVGGDKGHGSPEQRREVMAENYEEAGKELRAMDRGMANLATRKIDGENNGAVRQGEMERAGIGKLRDILDVNHDGTISDEEARKVYQASGLTQGYEDFRASLNSVGIKPEGASMNPNSLMAKDVEKRAASLRNIDGNLNGEINGSVRHGELKNAGVDNVRKMLDQNQDGKLTLDEVRKVYNASGLRDSFEDFVGHLKQAGVISRNDRGFDLSTKPSATPAQQPSPSASRDNPFRG